MSVTSVLPFNNKTSQETKSTLYYDDLKRKDKEERIQDQTTKELDEDLVMKKLQIERLKKKLDKPKKSLVSRVQDTFAESIGLKKENKENQEALEKEEDNLVKNTELIKLATARNCNASFIINLEYLLNTCSKNHLIEAYNKIIEILRDKKNTFNYQTKLEIDKLNNIYFDDKEELKKDNIEVINFDELKDTEDITKLKKKIESKLSESSNA